MEIIGHKKQQDFLKKLVKKDSLAHGYLFAGQEQLGKKTLALNFISLLLKENIEKLKLHPDFIFIEPNGKEIQISQIRELINKISFKPSIAKLKAVLIDNAQLMNQESQTSLLKTLEEPKGNILFILISDKPEQLFPTIISRLQLIKFYPLTKGELVGLLRDNRANSFSKEEKEELLEIAMGRPGLIIEMISQTKKLAEHNQKIKEIKKLSNAPIYFRFKYIKELSEDRGEAINLLNIWLYYYRKILIDEPTKKIIKIINLIEKTKFLIINTNINLKIALEKLILEI